MFEDIKKELTSLKLLSFLLTIAVGLYLLQFGWQFLGNFSEIFIVLLIAWLVSFILEPAVEKTRDVFNISKGLAALIAYIVLAGLIALAIFLFVPLVSFQFAALSEVIPKYLDTAPKFVQRWNDEILNILDNSASLIPSVANFLFLVLVVLIVSFYFIVDKEKIDRELYDLIPKNWHGNLRIVQKIINDTFASFVRVQITFAIISGVLTWLVLAILGVNFAASTGLISGILTIVPMIGPILAMIPPVFVAFISDPVRAIAAFIILLVAQQLIFNIWGPRFMGKAFNIHPVVVLLSFLIGLKVAGLAGAIFAIPVVSIIVLVIRDLGHLLTDKEANQKA